MIHVIENENLVVEINQTGAELFSIKSKKTGLEYLWQGNPEFWKARATVLFPVCGRMYEGKYYYDNKEYEMPIHGFAKLFDFSVEEKTEGSITLSLIGNEQTKKYYPFDFKFAVKYTLIDDKIETLYNVKNLDDKDMYFSLGGHPGFNVPFDANDKFEDYYIEFSSNELDKYVLSDKCFYLNKTQKFDLVDNKLNLIHDLFDNDALFFMTNSDVVKLKSNKHANYLEVSYKDMTALGLWHKPKTQAPYVCIEPWHGIPSDQDKIDNLSQKRQIIKLDKDKEYNTYINISVKES